MKKSSISRHFLWSHAPHCWNESLMYSIALCQVALQPSVRLATMTRAAETAAMTATIQKIGEARNERLSASMAAFHPRVLTVAMASATALILAAVATARVCTFTASSPPARPKNAISSAFAQPPPSLNQSMSCCIFSPIQPKAWVAKSTMGDSSGSMAPKAVISISSMESFIWFMRPARVCPAFSAPW